MVVMQHQIIIETSQAQFEDHLRASVSHLGTVKTGSAQWKSGESIPTYILLLGQLFSFIHINILLLSNENSGINAKVPGIRLP